MLHLFLIMSWLGICVEVAVDRKSSTRYSPGFGIRDSGFDQNTVGDSGNVNGIWLQLEAGFSNAAGSRPRFQAFSILYDDR